MHAMLKLARLIDALNDRIGRTVYWLVLVMVLLSAGNAIMRKLFSMSSNAYLEAQWYLFSAVFLLAAGYTLMKNEHVRIDIVSGHLSAKTRAWIDVFGIVLFLFPMVYLFVTLGWPFFVATWVTGEVSSNAGGLIRWPVKLLVPVGFALIFLQGVSEIIKRVAALGGEKVDLVKYERPDQ